MSRDDESRVLAENDRLRALLRAANERAEHADAQPRHRERRRQGTHCVTVDVSQSERDALVVRGYLSEEDRDNGAALKKRRLRPSSPISSWTYSTKPLSAVELAADRSETRHRSDSNSTLRVTVATAAALSEGRAS